MRFSCLMYARERYRVCFVARGIFVNSWFLLDFVPRHPVTGRTDVDGTVTCLRIHCEGLYRKKNGHWLTSAPSQVILFAYLFGVYLKYGQCFYFKTFHVFQHYLCWFCSIYVNNIFFTFYITHYILLFYFHIIYSTIYHTSIVLRNSIYFLEFPSHFH